MVKLREMCPGPSSWGYLTWRTLVGSGRLGSGCLDLRADTQENPGGKNGVMIAATFNDIFQAPAYIFNPVASLPPQADYVWRIMLMLGALPAALTFYWRMQMLETARYTALVTKNAKQAAADMFLLLEVELKPESDKVDQITQNSYGLFSQEFAKRHGLHLLGTASCWLLVDIGYYSQNLFQKNIFTKINWIPSAKSISAIEEVYTIARAQTLLAGTVPGY